MTDPQLLIEPTTAQLDAARAFVRAFGVSRVDGDSLQVQLHGGSSRIAAAEGSDEDAAVEQAARQLAEQTLAAQPSDGRPLTGPANALHLTFTVQIIGRWTLGVRDIWPDGDAPEQPAVHNVIDQMRRHCRSPDHVMRDWNMTPENVTVNEQQVTFR